MKKSHIIVVILTLASSTSIFSISKSAISIESLNMDTYYVCALDDEDKITCPEALGKCEEAEKRVICHTQFKDCEYNINDEKEYT